MALPIWRGSRFPVSLFEPTAMWDAASKERASARVVRPLGREHLTPTFPVMMTGRLHAKTGRG